VLLSLFLIVAVSDPAAQPEPLKIDILVKQPEAKCDAKSSDEIVVCAEKADNEQHRLRPIPKAAVYDKDESKAEFAVSENATMLAEGEAAGLPGGVQSNRLMVRLKLKF
jgi:hypothetical protein